MLTVVTFAYTTGGRPIYGTWHARNLRTMLAQHLTVPHRFVVVTDMVTEFWQAGFETIPLWDVHARLRAKDRFPVNCHVRLGLFDKRIGGAIGQRLLLLDLDMVIRANVDDLVAGDDPVKFLCMDERRHLQGGMVLLTPGAVQPNPWQVINSDPDLPRRWDQRHFPDSDQGVLSYLFYDRVRAGDLPHWSERDGVLMNQAIRTRDDWRVFLRTGERKSWQAGMEERAEYYRQSGLDLPPVPEHHERAFRGPPGQRRVHVTNKLLKP